VHIVAVAAKAFRPERLNQDFALLDGFENTLVAEDHGLVF
jgi:hypothetical protein